MVYLDSRMNISYTIPRPGRIYQQHWHQSRLSTSEITTLEVILDLYGLEITGEVSTSIGPGRSGKYIIESSKGKRVLKSYKHTVQLETIIHEHSILEYLAEENFPAPRLIRTRDSETYVQWDEEYYALYDYLEGYFQFHNYFMLPSQSLYFINLAGRALGALHDVLKEFTPKGHNPDGFISRTGDRWREQDWYTDQLDWCQSMTSQLGDSKTQQMIAIVKEFGMHVRDDFIKLDQKLMEASLPRFIIHGDYGPYNLFFKSGSRVVILDFELAGLDWRLIDMSKAFQYFTRNRLGFSFKKMKAFMDGYQYESPLTKEEKQLLPEVWLHLIYRRFAVIVYRYFNNPVQEYLREARGIIRLSKWIMENKHTISDL